MNCLSSNIIYAIAFKKEKFQLVYLGETKRQLKFCLSDHWGYVVNKDTSQATGAHFNLAGVSLADMSIKVIELAKKNDLIYRKECEEHHIRKIITLHKGLNRQV